MQRDARGEGRFERRARSGLTANAICRVERRMGGREQGGYVQGRASAGVGGGR